ncbi:MAG: hypothetical protein NTW75_00030 [Planctomycetales bacterium]|nr:hypothetical protein [Planctomycetales bacterium]
MKHEDSLRLKSLLEITDPSEEQMAEIETLLANDVPDRGRWTEPTLTGVAQFFNVALSTVKAWRASRPQMPGSDGTWPLAEIVRWRHDRLTVSDLATDRKTATLEAARLANDSRRLELERSRGQLLDRADVELWAATALIEARYMIMSLPERLSTSAPPEMPSFIREESDRHCRDVLIMLRRRLEMGQIDGISTLSTGDK